MNLARALVDVKKSVETKPNVPPGSLSSGAALGPHRRRTSCTELQPGTALDRGWPPLRCVPSGPRRRELSTDGTAPGFQPGEPLGARPVGSAGGCSASPRGSASSEVFRHGGCRASAREVIHGLLPARGVRTPPWSPSFGKPDLGVPPQGPPIGGSGTDSWPSPSGERPRVGACSTARRSPSGRFPRKSPSGGLQVSLPEPTATFGGPRSPTGVRERTAPDAPSRRQAAVQRCTLSGAHRRVAHRSTSTPSPSSDL